jgi:hypothetical protein
MVCTTTQLMNKTARKVPEVVIKAGWTNDSVKEII